MSKRVEQERMILGAWMVGNHTEDMELFEPGDFMEGNLFCQIKQGKDAWSISETLHRPITDLVSMSNQYLETFYYMAVNELLLDKAKKSIEDINEISDLQVLSRSIDEYCSRSCRIKSDSGLYDTLRDELNQIRNGNNAKYGLNMLDEWTGGIYRKNLLVVSAKTSVGKSAFALQIAENVSKTNKVLYFPLEMSTTEMIERLLIRNELATLQELKSGNIDRNSDKIETYISDMENKGNLKFYEGVSSLEKICSITSKEEPYLVIIDQLSQVTTGKKFSNLAEQYGYITKTLKALSMKNVAVLLLCQISVKDIQEDSLASIKNSSQISEDADNVILLERVPIEKVKNTPNLNNRFFEYERCIKLSLAKQRFGRQGKYFIAFNPSKQRYYEKMISNDYA